MLSFGIPTVPSPQVTEAAKKDSTINGGVDGGTCSVTEAEYSPWSSKYQETSAPLLQTVIRVPLPELPLAQADVWLRVTTLLRMTPFFSLKSCIV